MQIQTFKASQPTSLGEYEALAGIENRVSYWKPYQPLASINTQFYIDTALEDMDKLIQKRVADGQFTLLCDLSIGRQMRRERLRKARRANKVEA